MLDDFQYSSVPYLVNPLSNSSTTIVIVVDVDEPKGVGVKVGVGVGVKVGVGVGVRVRVGVEVGVGVRVGGEVGVGVGVGVLVGVGVGGAGEMGKFGNAERSMKYAIPQTTIQTTPPTTATRTRVFPSRGISLNCWRRWGRIGLSMPSGILPTLAQITVIGPNKIRRVTKTTARSSRVSFIDVTCIDVTCLVHD